MSKEPDTDKSVTCSGCGKVIRKDIQSRWYAIAGPWHSPDGTWAALDPRENPAPWHCAARETGEHRPGTEKEEGTQL